MQGIDVICIQITEPVVGTEVSGSHIVRTLTEHHTHGIAFHKAPTGYVLPANLETQYIAKINGASVEIRDREHERPGCDFGLHMS